ncbi:MAG: hypothetical protein ACR2GZ_08755 [Solirubrobacteraceae bacterium]
MRGLLAPLTLVLARGRRRPGRWLAAVLGLALATGFACGVAGEATISGDRAARRVLRDAPPLSRIVRLTAQGPASTAREQAARGLLRRLGIESPSHVVLLNPVRLGGLVVRPAAISPLTAWVGRPGARLAGCAKTGCPVLRTTALDRADLSAYGVHLRVAGAATLASAVPLGFAPAAGGGPPVVLSGDPAGLDRIPGLSGVYRTESWVSVRSLARLDSWQLGAVEARLQRVQVGLPANGAFVLDAPFDLLDRARAQAAAAPRRLLLAGGGGLAALAGFIVLAAFALRQEREADVRRLATAGARTSQRALFALAEAGALAALGLLVGAALGLAATAVLAAGAHLPVGAVLTRSVLTVTGTAVLAGGWAVATTLVSLVLLLPSARVADVLAAASAAALALTLTRAGGDGGPLPILLAPLACASAGVLVYRVAVSGLRGLERLSRDGPPILRLALIGLARAPAAPALAIAFIAVSTGLGGFALGYRATLARGQADAASDRIPLDALVAPGASYATPLQGAPLARWQALAGGRVLPVRRTDASFAVNAAAVTVPALGVPAAGLGLIGGWRTSDGPAPLAALGRRLRPSGPVRSPGPELARTGGRLTVGLRARGGAAVVTADLRAPDGALIQLPVGTATARRQTVAIRIPSGGYELAALSLAAPAGVEITSGHQNGESLTAATQSATDVTIGPVRTPGGAGERVSLAGWRAVGAAAGIGPGAAGSLRVRFDPAGNPGVLRPVQPSDTAPVRVLTDPATAAAAPHGRLALTVDGLPVSAQVVGTLRRFPTVPADDAGFVIADQSTLAAALDASLPGAGRPDELWINSPRPGRLRAALSRPPLSGLDASFRGQFLRRLQADPIARGVLGTLLAAAGVGLGLAVLGLLVVLFGALRDPHAERALIVQGLGPRALRRELALRVLTAAGLGLTAGLVVALALTRLAVAAVEAGSTLAPPAPPLVAVAPWGGLALAALLALFLFVATAWLSTRLAAPGRRR